MTQDQHQELAHLRAEIDRLQDEVSRGITALAECIGERDKAYKVGLLRAAQVCRETSETMMGGAQAAMLACVWHLEAEAEKGGQ